MRENNNNELTTAAMKYNTLQFATETDNLQLSEPKPSGLKRSSLKLATYFDVNAN
ncbi:hypothetical protein GCM10009409_39050 [Shewanella saliphila]|uniref:Uncharacterized protein n=1 Tax=Shewanella saliphila TaxID=2282698 RepID=A0ABQ2QB00_9GAMM|nr:hypothetical protein GCM10009409_39050 [Shewanella saliphila]